MPYGIQPAMKTVVLHAGLPKTGSTSIQDFLFAERDLLTQEGFLFPSVESTVRAERNRIGENWGRHASLLAAMQGRWQDLAEGEWDLWLAEMQRFREDHSLHTMLLSHETIGNRGGSLGFSLLHQLFDDYHMRIMVVVREAEAWLTSLYEQRVSGRMREVSPPDQLNTMKNYCNHGYQSRIETWRTAFPAADIMAVSFENLVAGDGLVPNVCDLIGLPARSRARAHKAKRVNTALSQDAVELMRRCKVIEVPAADFVAVRRALTIVQRLDPRPKAARQRIFGARFSERIASRYEADRRWFAAELGVRLAEPRRPVPIAITYPAERLEALVAAARPHLTAAQGAALGAALAAPPPEPWARPARDLPPTG